MPTHLQEVINARVVRATREIQARRESLIYRVAVLAADPLDGIAQASANFDVERIQVLIRELHAYGEVLALLSASEYNEDEDEYDSSEEADTDE